jgi:signal transduction histidine kinase
MPHRDSAGTPQRATGPVEGSHPASGVPSPVGMRGGLGKTLLTAFLLLAIVPLGLLAFATYNQIQNDTRHNVLASLDMIVVQEEAHLVDWVAGYKRELGLLAGLCGDLPALSEACTARATAWLTETQAAALVLVQVGPPEAGGASRTVVQTIAGDGGVLGEGSLEGIEGGGPLMVPADSIGSANRANREPASHWDSGSTPQLLVAISYRLAGGERYLVTLLPWQSLQGLIGTPLGRAQPDVTTWVSVATRDEDFGFWVLDSVETPSGQGLGQGVETEAAGGRQVHPAQGIEQALSGQSGSGLYTNLAGVPVLGAYRWNSQLEVAVVAEQPQAEVLAAGNTLTAVIVAITLGMALVTAAIAAVVTRRVTRPIVQLTETAARMAHGDLDQQVIVTRQDEIGVLAHAFNRMAAELRVLYGDLNAKVEFLTNMSHALRTPLTSIIGFSRLMLKELDGPLTDVQRADLVTIHEGGQQLLELINDMLELSELELETAPMTVDEVDLAGMIDGVMATARALALNKPVTLLEEVPDGLPTLYTDGRRVRRVLLAMMSNAIRITDDGSIQLSATAGDGRVTIRVQAIGATGQAESLGQGDRSGVGLTRSQQMVEKLGGRIRIERDGSGGASGTGEGRQAATIGGANPIACAIVQHGEPAAQMARSVFTFTLPISPSDIPDAAHDSVVNDDSA